LLIIKKFINNIISPIECLISEINYFAKNQSKRKTLRTFSKYPMFQNLLDNFIIMKRNIQKRENELIELNKNLETIVKEKTLTLQNINKNLADIVQEEVQKNKEKDKVMFEQSKMAAMGEMIGNIAHQWRQPLSLISTVASGLIFKKDMGVFKEEELIENLDKIVHTTQFLSHTIDDFRNFFKKDKEKTRFNIKSVIKTNLDLISASIDKNNINIKTELLDIEIYGYHNELIQALINIINNAKDAFIEQNIQHKRYIIIETKTIEKNIIISIQDNANGIPQDIMNKIFEPYFTTKHKSQGTGIGLYMTQEIIVKHMHGKLNVKNNNFTIENQEYTGALFTIQIPISLDE